MDIMKFKLNLIYEIYKNRNIQGYHFELIRRTYKINYDDSRYLRIRIEEYQLRKYGDLISRGV